MKAIYIDNSGVVRYIAELPEEPHCLINLIANLDYPRQYHEYCETLQAAKDSAIELDNSYLNAKALFDFFKDLGVPPIHLPQWLSERKDTTHPFPDQYEVEVREEVDHVLSGVTPFGSLAVYKKLAVIIPKKEHLKEQFTITRKLMTRQEVYHVIDTERDYQENLWSNLNKDINNPSSYILWMQYQLDKAKELACTIEERKGTEGNQRIMAFIRKCTALGVAAMEMNGAPERAL